METILFGIMTMGWALNFYKLGDQVQIRATFKNNSRLPFTVTAFSVHEAVDLLSAKIDRLERGRRESSQPINQGKE